MKKATKVFDDEFVHESIKNFKSDQIDLGVLISQMEFPYNETKVVTLIPRYVIVNATHRPIIFTQDSGTSQKQIYLNPKDETPYFFENQEKKNYIKIRELAPEEDSLDISSKGKIEDHLWSSCISPEEIEDF